MIVHLINRYFSCYYHDHDIDFVAINFELLNTSVLYVYKLIFDKRHICRTSIYEIQFHNAFYVTITKTRCREQKYWILRGWCKNCFMKIIVIKPRSNFIHLLFILYTGKRWIAIFEVKYLITSLSPPQHTISLQKLMTILFQHKFGKFFVNSSFIVNHKPI